MPGYVLVTGASAGLGTAFVRRFAAEERNLVLVARDVAQLDALAAELRERFPIDVEVLAADLTTEAGCAAVVARLESTDRPVDVLVNNAGLGIYQSFDRSELADELGMLDLNVRAVLVLTHAAVRAMTARGAGQIINVSSVAGFLPRGAAATYAASKSWVTSFTRGISLLLRGTGVSISAICPGFTHTEFHARANADMGNTPSWMWLQADRVVADGLADVRAGKVVSVPSRRYKFIVGLVRFTPQPILNRIMARR
ncbi:MAG TPA: SDR family oxidoreductase [Jatrophihabitans sp.]|nr:SDR family oxidoreductase [Jatrophihabitans sp.]